MTADAIVPLVAMAGWLVLAIAGYRTQDVGRGKMLRQLAIWTAIFGVAALAFAWFGL